MTNEENLLAIGAMFGRKVITPAGEGTLIQVTMPHNGLYIEPERADLLVWYGSGGEVGWSWRTWRIGDVSLAHEPKATLAKTASGGTLRCGQHGLPNEIRGDRIGCRKCFEVNRRAE